MNCCSPVESTYGTLFFAADDGVHGSELWMSDGTSPGTRMVVDAVAGPGSLDPWNLTEVNGTLFFSAGSHDGSERALWKSDGTAGGTVFVADTLGASFCCP